MPRPKKINSRKKSSLTRRATLKSEKYNITLIRVFIFVVLLFVAVSIVSVFASLRNRNSSEKVVVPDVMLVDVPPTNGRSPEVSGYVYGDLNQNALKDTKELGFGNITIECKVNGTDSCSSNKILTDKNGKYLIYLKPTLAKNLKETDKLTVSVVPPINNALPVVPIIKTTTNPSFTFKYAGKEVQNVNFGLKPVVMGFIYFDHNNDGKYNPKTSTNWTNIDYGIGDFPAYLYRNKVIIGSDTSSDTPTVDVPEGAVFLYPKYSDGEYYIEVKIVGENSFAYKSSKPLKYKVVFDKPFKYFEFPMYYNL